MSYSCIVVGATGLVGTTILQVLEERNFPVGKLRLVASEKSAGKRLTFRGEEIAVEAISEEVFAEPFDIAFFSAGATVSGTYCPIAAKSAKIVVDNSSRWRMDPAIPLVVPEVNPSVLKGYRGIVANPNCSTIQCMPPLKVIDELYGLKRVIYSTYQACAGAGMKGLADLKNGTTEKFEYPIVGNVLAHIDVFMEDGYTKEERKMIEETRKILGHPELPITATTVRVPVDFGHSVSINVECERTPDPEVVKAAMANAAGVILRDDPANLVYPIPDDCKGRDEIFVGRIRKDTSCENGLNLWCVADNIRKGAATNTIQIAEAWLEVNR